MRNFLELSGEQDFLLSLSSAMLSLDHVLSYIGIQLNYNQITINHCVGSIIPICAFNYASLTGCS